MMSATSSYSFGPKPLAGGQGGRCRFSGPRPPRPGAVEGHGVAVDGDAAGGEQILACWPSISLWPAQVDHHQMHIGAAGQHGDAVGLDVVGQ